VRTFEIPAYRLGLFVDEYGRLVKVFVQLEGYEPMDILFQEDSWIVDGVCPVDRRVEVGDVNPLFQVVFKSSGACKLTWTFTAEFYGIVLPDGDFIEVNEGCRVYSPIYFHYDMVKRKCKRTITINFKGRGECIFQLHIHKDFYLANGFSGIAILTYAGVKEHYKFPIALLTLGLVPKPRIEALKLIHKYYTPIIVLDESNEEDFIDALKYILENMPINVVIIPEEYADTLTSKYPMLNEKRVVKYDAYANAYKEAIKVYKELFSSEPNLDGGIEVTGVKGCIEVATYAHLKNMKIVDGVGEDFNEKTSKELFNLRVILEETILKDSSIILSIPPPFKDLKEYCKKFSEDILGLVSPDEIYSEALKLLYKPRSITVTVFDELTLQVALIATAYAVSRNTPVITVEQLSQEDKEAIEEHLKKFAIAEREVKERFFQDAFLKARMEGKSEDEARRIALMKVNQLNMNMIMKH
jgi:hypothetical protein